ncbi:MAG: alpha/beta hydrolase-fold protein [Candidatus Eisenbacteria bacterium]
MIGCLSLAATGSPLWPSVTSWGDLAAVVLTWVAVWVGIGGGFVLLVRKGLDYVHGWHTTSVYFSLGVAVAALLFRGPLQPVLAALRPADVVWILVGLGIQLGVVWFARRNGRPPEKRITDAPHVYWLRGDPRYAFSKTFEILFQQTMLVALVHALAAAGFGRAMIVLLAVPVFGLVHVPITRLVGRYFGTYYFAFSLVAAVLMPLLILSGPHGFVLSYLLHVGFYAGSQLLFWDWSRGHRTAAAVTFAIILGSHCIPWIGPGPASGTEPQTPSTVPTTCLVSIPDGTAPSGGWPVFVLMHGYGTNKEDFDDLARVVSGRGAVAISVDAPQDLGGGRRSWGPDIHETHRYLQAQLAPLLGDARFDFTPIHVGGFSQGGIRSLLLAAWYPDVYGGVLSVAPAGGDWPERVPDPTRPHPLRLVYGTADNERIQESASHAETFWREWGQPYEVFTHRGGHHFPSDWVQVLGDGVTQILRQSVTE